MFLLAVMMIAAGQQNATLKGHDEPQQISPEIVKAWENAGAKYGIIITNDFGHFRFTEHCIKRLSFCDRRMWYGRQPLPASGLERMASDASLDSEAQRLVATEDF